MEKDKLLKQGEIYSSGVKHSSVNLYLNNEHMFFFMKAKLLPMLEIGSN